MFIPTNKVSGSKFLANECNEITKEMQAIITSSGLSLDANNTTQVLQSLQILSLFANSCDVASNSTANNIQLNTKIPTENGSGTIGIKEYTDGMQFEFRATASNTSRVTIEIDNKGAKSLLDQAGAELVAGDIIATGFYKVIYSKSTDKFTEVTGNTGSFPLNQKIKFISDLYPIGSLSTQDFYNITNPKYANGGLHWKNLAELDTLGTGALLSIANIDKNGNTTDLNAYKPYIDAMGNVQGLIGEKAETDKQTIDQMAGHKHEVTAIAYKNERSDSTQDSYVSVEPRVSNSNDRSKDNAQYGDPQTTYYTLLTPENNTTGKASKGMTFNLTRKIGLPLFIRIPPPTEQG